MTESIDQVIELDLGCVPEAAISGAVLVQTERTTLLTFNAMRIGEDGQRHRAGTALVEFPGCQVTQFGYPNDEALDGHPLWGSVLDAYAVFEVLNPSWARRLEEQNRKVFPGTGHWNLRHFIITFHDSTFECLAEGVELRVVDEPYERIFGRIAGRVCAE